MTEDLTPEEHAEVLWRLHAEGNDALAVNFATGHMSDTDWRRLALRAAQWLQERTAGDGKASG